MNGKLTPVIIGGISSQVGSLGLQIPQARCVAAAIVRADEDFAAAVQEQMEDADEIDVVAERQHHVVGQQPRAPSPERPRSARFDLDQMSPVAAAPESPEAPSPPAAAAASAATSSVAISREFLVQHRESEARCMMGVQRFLEARWNLNPASEGTPLDLSAVSPPAPSDPLPQMKRTPIDRLAEDSPLGAFDQVALESARKVSTAIRAAVGNTFNKYPRGHSYLTVSGFVPLPCEYMDMQNVLARSLQLIQADPNVIRVAVPEGGETVVRVFGDIHGQIQDLCSFLTRFGAPEECPNVKYVFLGDYVDRGTCSLHVMLLLLSYKIQFPDRIFMIRGNHEDMSMSRENQFYSELIRRFAHFTASHQSEYFGRVCTLFTDIFDWLPLAGVIGEKIFCVHGGIGPSLERIEQLEEAAVQRPIRHPRPNFASPTGAHADGRPLYPAVATGIWSDPAESSSVPAGMPGRDNGYATGRSQRFMSTYCAKDVTDFCEHNGVDCMVRCHECPEDGIDFFAGGKCITVFSATQYCGPRSSNAGCILEIQRNARGQIVILPKIMIAGNLSMFTPRGGL